MQEIHDLSFNISGRGLTGHPATIIAMNGIGREIAAFMVTGTVDTSGIVAGRVVPSQSS